VENGKEKDAVSEKEQDGQGKKEVKEMEKKRDYAAAAAAGAKKEEVVDQRTLDKESALED
jgi:hypothetical protein